jgi:hypothetical protein
MSIDKKESEHLVFISYARSGYKDVEDFKRVLGNLSSPIVSGKDVVVDCSSCKYMTSPEIGALVRLANDFQKTKRFLRIIPSEEFHKTLLSINLQYLEHLIIYKSKKAFTDHLKDKAAI